MELIYKKPNVLCILDNFSFNCFKPECDILISFDISKIKKHLSQYKFDFFLCESAWKPIGGYYNLGTHDNVLRYTIYKDLQNVTNLLKSLKIPTVFWNKEDNVSYDKFKIFASLFDHIFTTDSRTFESYKKDCPNAKTIESLLFAAQPQIHNPINSINDENKHDGDVFFAGGWYSNFTQRIKDMQNFLKIPKNIKFHIYERDLVPGKQSKFPVAYHSNIKYSIDYIEMSKKYKNYKIMLNVNSVVDSPTMFSRRVPECLLSGTTIISSPSLAISYVFPYVFIKTDEKNMYDLIKYVLNNSEYRREHNHYAKRYILTNHIYFNRMEKICKTIGIRSPEFKTGVVNLYYLSNNSSHNNLLLNDIKEQTYSNIISNIQLNNSELNILKNLFYNRQLPNGNIFNNIGFVCLFYVGNRYEPNYVLDSILSYKYFTDIDVIGKGCIYEYNNSKVNIINPELENRYTSQIHPYTVTISLAGDIKKRQSKLNYLLNIILSKPQTENLKIYSSDKYNFIYVK